MLRNIIIMFMAAFVVAACCNCKAEPIVQQNRALIIPPNIDKVPA